MGGSLLARGLNAWVSAQAVTRRFRKHLSARVAAPWLIRKVSLWTATATNAVANSKVFCDLEGELFRAGYISAAAPLFFYLSRLIGCLASAGLVLLSSYLKHGPVTSKSLALAFFVSFFVYRGFGLLLRARAKSRQCEIRREFPSVLDLLLMVLDSGVSVDQALYHVSLHISHVAPLTARELARYIADVEDATPYDKALDRLAQRLAIHEGHDFSALLKQNLFQGGELSPSLRRLAADISDTRLAYAREQVGRKSVLLTLVMLGFFMPVLLLAVAGPAISDVVGTLSHVARDLQNSRGGR
jgi:tight adherence protein C